MEALFEEDLKLASSFLILYLCEPICKSQINKVISQTSKGIYLVKKEITSSDYWVMRAYEYNIDGNNWAALICITYARFLRDETVCT